jgi:hypothetical protein
MTRKDYILIAAALKEAAADILNKECPVQDLLDGKDYAAEHIADALARDNPRFDRERFLKAAGVQS